MAKDADRHPGGRPPLDPGERRTLTIGVRVRPDERETLAERADSQGITPGQLLRECALTRRLPSPPVPAANREQYAELARLAANLNQLAKAANEGQPVSVETGMLQEVHAEVQRLRLALLGIGDDREADQG
ncbi:plasmid mobilization protein [Haloferax sp. KTX1]|uniref:plasmid mobilization protein n=1 Tax=Haloferax sp. KTX1 TaxID=2600597 RepID=UPI0011DD3647|nr:plasmid mobilization relaxosome protein MobC [Haloferax sp. KTX1]